MRIELVLHVDLLSPWCWIAEERIAHAAESFGRFSELVLSPFPLRPDPRIPSARERRLRVRDLLRAAQEPEGQRFSPELWAASDPPACSLPPLIAVAAARFLGAAEERAMRDALRRAALLGGLNIGRMDVVLELAERLGLDMDLFTTAALSPATERSVRFRYEAALDRGICEVPSLVIGGEWLVSGTRAVLEYRSILGRYLVERQGLPNMCVVH
jgi:predicted DsbA family dithiol-disulfide isomerase